jgi:hypothetical protein
LYRVPFRDVEDLAVPLDGLRIAEGSRPRNFRAGEQRWLARHSPTQLFYAFDKQVHRITMTEVEWNNLPTAIREPLLKGPIRMTNETDWLVDKKLKRPVPLPLGLVDLNVLQDDEEILIPTAEGALVIHAPVKVLQLPGDSLCDRINHLRVLDDRHLMVANELGVIQIWDYTRDEIVHEPKFHNFAWLGDVSGHHYADRYEVWAINRRDHKLYHWSSASDYAGLRAVDSLPAGVDPVSLSTFAYRTPTTGPSAHGGAGGLTNFFLFGNEVIAERVMILGADGRIHAWVEPDGLMTDPLQASQRVWTALSPLDEAR